MGFTSQKIAIIGGGLGGMSFANAALHVGLTNITLYEAAAQFTEVGAGVNITRNANRILDAYGLKDAMLQKASTDAPLYMQYRNYKTGALLGQIDEFGPPTSRLIHRAHLLDVLKSRVPEAMLKTGKRLRKIEYDQPDQEYSLSFEDGSTATAGIIIGCDGIKSVVREYLGIRDDPNYSGQVVYRGYVRYEDLLPETADVFRKTVNFRGHRKHVLTLPIGNDKSRTARIAVIGFMTEPLAEWKSESWMATAPIESLQDHVKDWCPLVQELIEGLRKNSQDGKMLKQALYVRNPVDKWFHAEESNPSVGIVLVGDSVHSTLPHQGQGTCMAIESGIALATILRNWATNDLSSACALYKEIRKPRTDKITRTSYEAGKLASAELPDDFTDNFRPELLRERMKWIMEGDVLAEVYEKGGPLFEKGWENQNAVLMRS
jgi:salicylate hydroxylase